MKIALGFLFFLCFAMANRIGQAAGDVVRLNNGEVYRGQIAMKDLGGTIELKVGRNETMVFAPMNINPRNLPLYGCRRNRVYCPIYRSDRKPSPCPCSPPNHRSASR
jgi:hypothetical protein